MFDALICINNHILSCLVTILSITRLRISSTSMMMVGESGSPCHRTQEAMKKGVECPLLSMEKWFSLTQTSTKLIMAVPTKLIRTLAIDLHSILSKAFSMSSLIMTLELQMSWSRDCASSCTSIILTWMCHPWINPHYFDDMSQSRKALKRPIKILDTSL